MSVQLAGRSKPHALILIHLYKVFIPDEKVLAKKFLGGKDQTASFLATKLYRHIHNNYTVHAYTN